MDCSRLHLFWDGELNAQDARAFGAHLAGCTPCQAELDALAQFDALAERYVRLKDIRRPWWRRLSDVVARLWRSAR